jgi:hypothetical protein
MPIFHDGFLETGIAKGTITKSFEHFKTSPTWEMHSFLCSEGHFGK